MKDLVNIIERFFNNSGADKYIDLINNFGSVISNYADIKEIERKRWKSSMPGTRMYKKLYNLFNDTPSFEATYDCVFNTIVGGSPFKTDVCTQRFTFIRKNNSFRYRAEYLHARYPEENRVDDIECKDFTEFLSNFVLYINNAYRYDLLRNSAKFIITH